MAIAAYPATLKIGANSILDLQTHDLPFKMDTDETTAFSGSGGAAVGTKTFIPTLLGMQCKVSGNWNKADTTGQLVLENNFFARTKTTLIYSDARLRIRLDVVVRDPCAKCIGICAVRTVDERGFRPGKEVVFQHQLAGCVGLIPVARNLTLHPEQRRNKGFRADGRAA